MVNFGYPYNDLVICKDSTDYLEKLYNVKIGKYIDMKLIKATMTKAPRRFEMVSILFYNIDTTILR